MFKYLPQDPSSPRSIIKAGLQLYFASFKYSLALAISASLLLSIVFYGLNQYTQLNNFIMSFLATILSFIFYIPLIKRIYSVAAGLPITTRHAYDGFITQFIRVTILFCLITYLSIFMLIVVTLVAPYPNLLIFSTFVLLIGYAYIAIKLYFTDMFIILENQHIWTALVSSSKIEHHHMWLTFWVISIFVVSSLVLLTFILPYLSNTLIGDTIISMIYSVFFIPMFISIQLSQFFNLKNLTARGH